MTLAAHEDKTFGGGYIASPSMPWIWGSPKIENPSGAYHLVWSRDLYQIATALIAAGDTAGANRAVDYLFFKQQKSDGSFPQNSTVDGKEHWTNLQLDQVALPIVLAWQLGRTDGGLYRDHIKKAANFIVNFPNAPFSPQERWENQSGFSPGTIAAEIAGLVCAADIARKNGDPVSAARYEKTADDWQKRVQGWTATTNGPYSPRPYYLRLTKDGKPQLGHAYNIGDSGPTVDQRKVVDPSYLELVRLGVKRANDPAILNTVSVVDQQLAAGDPSGRFFWHRFNFDGYGEQKDGSPWDFGFPRTKPRSGRTTRPSAATGRSSAVSAASTSWRPATPALPARVSRTWRRPRTTARCCRSRCGRRTSRPPASPASRSARAPSRPRRWRGRTLSSCASRGRSTPAAPWSGPASSRRATPGANPGRSGARPHARRAGTR